MLLLPLHDGGAQAVVGNQALVGSLSFVIGLVAWPSSQLSSASRSYVYPSPAITGSFITSCKHTAA